MTKPNQCLAWALLLAAVLSLSANAAVEMAIEIPGIPGDSQLVGLEGQIDLLSWHQDVANVDSTSVVFPLTFIHYVDRASAKLIEAAVLDSTLPYAKLTVRQVAGDLNPVLLTLTLHNATVVSLQDGGINGESSPTQIVKLTCQTFEYEWFDYDVMGPPQSIIASGNCN